MTKKIRLIPENYTVGWLYALAWTEQVAAIKMLDERHEELSQPDDDDNTYTYGSIKGHNIVIACLPIGQPGEISASRLVESLPKSFPTLRIHLMVGIGGGIPRDSPSTDLIRTFALGTSLWEWLKSLVSLELFSTTSEGIMDTGTESS